ncbi:MAG: TatD family hydrolase [Planctomycetes bacterium]|nr:TatD family hydrolase [Planctomycetota bacterium]
MRLFDTHCHLTWHMDEDPPTDRLARARKAGVDRLLTVAVDLESARTCASLAAEHEGVQASAGIHPHDVPSGKELDQQLQELETLLESGQYSAVGETGLDFYRDWSQPADQTYSLEYHLALGARFDLPIILHCRESAQALLEILQAQNRAISGVMHCFSEGAKYAHSFLDLGLHVSFAGNLTYPKSEALREAAKIVPNDRLLVETDAPFLAPQVKRGKRNEPAYVAHTLAFAAEVRGVAAEELAEQTYGNAMALFASM